MDTKNSAEKFWDSMANQFDKWTSHFEQPPIENAKKYVRITDVVLDYGCATGTVSIGIADNVKEVKGIDISSKMIAAARRKAHGRKILNVDFVQSTIFDERLKGGSFDVILAFNILHFFKDTQEIVIRFSELLKPGGLIISVTACMGEKTLSNTFQYILFSPLMKLGIIPYMRFLKTSELESSMTNVSFQIIEIENLNGNPSNCFIVAKKI
jgi:2-polyprenyl-3-methyl-5-hydroxy-6-metoxy-1,4-benzoquinol methylase